VPEQQVFQHHAAPRAGRLRVGYLSSDFYDHATAYLMAELVERHDRDRFEVYGYSYGADPGGDMRARLVSAFERFTDIDALAHRDAAARIRADDIDILVDLKGHTHRARPKILAFRPAPVQVNYLGYPGTMGAPFIDYIIADDFIVPRDRQMLFAEKLAYLPDCYQPNDTQRDIAATPSRVECGLPAQGFVFCGFNNSFKITPAFFAIWMRLLQQVPGSVLWLLESNALVRRNLTAAAVTAGVDPARLVFAPILPHGQHLARHRVADLFLDTLPCNAHTTASDALWAGLPVLTCVGETFAGRVAGSIVRAAGLPELVTTSPRDYEALALKLAHEPARLNDIRSRLGAGRENLPLFDMAKRTRDLESIYARMAEIWRSGQPAAPITL
jgi:predicted O-linked N-acetylglucosamine transferase (SPINDLY family)